MNLRFLDPAEEEMTEAARIYEDQAAGLGERFAASRLLDGEI